MAVFGANITHETLNLVSGLLKSDAFVKFSLQNDLDLNDNTVLIRLALINLIQHLPDNDEVLRYRAALLRPREFDKFCKKQIEEGIDAD